MNSERLGYLISLYLDGSLAPAEKAELESALLSSASVRSQFWSETKLHEQLRVVEQEVYASDPPKAPDSDRLRALPNASLRGNIAWLNRPLIGLCQYLTTTALMHNHVT